MRKTLKKTLALSAVLACAFGMGAMVSCISPDAGNGNDPPATTVSTYAITCTATAGVQVSAPTTAESGDTVKLTLTLSEGYYLRKIVVNGQELTSASFVMPDCDVTVKVYAANADTAYEVTAASVKGGTVTPAVTEAKYGDTVSATVKANDGYRLKKLYANGVEILFEETEDFTYSAKAYMQDTELEFKAVFAENPVVNEEYDYVLSNMGDQDAYFNAQYLENGLSFTVLVADDNVVQNGRLGTEERDYVEFRVCAATTQSLENANALRCLVTADGTFLLQKCLGADDYGLSGYEVGYVYGENFSTETFLCTKSKNGFDGYAVEVFLGYDLFGLTKQTAVGNMTFAPARNNTLGTDGKKATTGTVRSSAEIPAIQANAERYFADGYKCDLQAPATYLSVTADGSIVGRFDSVYENADCLFYGDGSLTAESWKRFTQNVADKTVCNVAFEGMTVADYATEAAIATAKAVSPASLLFSVGAKDAESGASAATVVARIKNLLQTYNAALPQTQLYWTALLKNTVSAADSNLVSTVNAAMKEFALTTDYLTIVDANENLRADGVVNGALTAEGYDTYVTAVCTALGLETPLEGSEMFGSSTYGDSSFGWTVEDGALALTSRTGADKKYAYFTGDASASFTASADFSATDLCNGDETPKFGFVIANGNGYLYFYITETYYDGELMNTKIAYEFVQDGKVRQGDVLTVALFYRDGAATPLSVEKSRDSITLKVGNYTAWTLTDETVCGSAASVGVFSENMLIKVQNATIER